MKTLREHIAKGSDVTVRISRRPDGSYTVTKTVRKRVEFTDFGNSELATAHYRKLVRETKE